MATSEPIQMLEYGELLRSVDFHSGKMESIETFIEKTQLSDPLPEPVFLGKDNDMRYYLQSERPYIVIKYDLKEDVTDHPFILELRNPHHEQTKSKFVFCLGTLVYVRDFQPTPNGPKFNHTPFRVYLDIVTRMVWIVLDRFTADEEGPEEVLNKNADPWSFLPSPRLGRRSFHATSIGNVKNLGSIERNQSPFHFVDFGEEEELRPYVASYDAVMSALEKGAKGCSAGHSPEAGV